MITEPPTSQRQSAEVLLQFLTDKILNPYGKEQVSALAWKKFSSENQVKTVVVVGEVARGKSALANALVGVKGASPAGVNFTTAVPVALGVSDSPQCELDTQLFYSDRTESINHRDLEGHINGQNQAEKLKRDSDVPTRAFVRLSDSDLNCVVVDTPGIGGLDPKHALLAQNSAEKASVLVVTCDASTPITAPEMEFIREGARHVENVIVAVTKIDKNFSRWEQIVEKDKELLETKLGRHIPVIGVSSLLAVYDSPTLSSEDREGIHKNSGIIELREAVEHSFRTAENIPAVHGLRVASLGIKDLKDELLMKIETIEQAEDAIPELNEQLEKLQTLKRELEQWEQYLIRDITHARQNALENLDIKLEDLKQKWTDFVAKHGIAVLRKAPQHFTAQIEKDFQEAVLSTLETFTEDFNYRVIQPRFDSRIVQDEITEEMALALIDKSLKTSEVKKKSDGIFDPMMLLMGASGGSILGAALASVVSFSGLGIVAGVGWVTFNVGFRAMRSGKQNLLLWIRETTGTTKMFTSRLLEAAIANARPEIVIRYRELLRSSLEETQEQMRTAQKAATMAQQTRDSSIARLRKNIEIIEKNITRIDHLIEDLRKESIADVAKEAV